MKPLVWVGIALLLSALVGGYALRSTEEPAAVVPAAEPVRAEPIAPAPAVAASTPEADPEPAAPEPEPAPSPADEDDGVRRIDLTSNPNFFALFEELGIEDVEGKLAQWGLSRGYPQLDEQGNVMLDQPYEQYDDATLLAFAEGDDMWAQQFLAERLAEKSPAEAVKWYEKAAENGSVHAMTQLARLYRDLQLRPAPVSDDPNSVRAQIDGLRESGQRLDVTGYAWAAVAERAGWDPLRGGMTAGFVGAKLNDAQREEACQRAEQLYSSLVSARSGRGLGEYPTNPPPVVFDPGAVTGTGCGSDPTPVYQSQCREVEVSVAGQVSRLWTCDEPGQ